MIRLAIVGYGYWGPNLLRNFLLAKGCRVSVVCDLNTLRLDTIQKLNSSIKITSEYRDILRDNTIDAVVIATPSSTHFSLASLAIKAGKDVLVEKPMTTTSSEAQNLTELAQREKRILMVDHTFVYSKPIEEIAKIIKKTSFGKIVNIDSVRVNLGLYQRDINVVADLAVHDFTILDYLLQDVPEKIAVIGAKHFDSHQEDQAYLHMWYASNTLVNINVSWLSPIKVRRMIICGTKQMLVYDDMEVAEKIKRFNTGIRIERDPKEIFKMKVGYHQGDIFSPNIEIKEPLTSVVEDFIGSVKKRKAPRCDGYAGLRVVKVLEGAMHSLRSGGKIIGIE